MKRLSSELITFDNNHTQIPMSMGDSDLIKMMSMMGSAMPIPQIDNTIDSEAVINDKETIEVETDENDFILDFVAPFQLTVENDSNPGQYQAINTFIATNKNGKVFTISTIYLLENEEEKAHVDNIPYNSSNEFISVPITSNIIINNLDNYVTDFGFEYIDEDDDINKFTFVAKKINSDKSFSEDKYTFKMTSDIFSSIKYIDSYIFDMITNNHDLGVASIVGKSVENPTPISIVDKIDRIIAMTEIKKNSTDSAIEFIIVDNNGEKNTILSIFDFGGFPKKKYKKMTIDKLQKLYLQESDQYIQVYSNSCKFNNIDKGYYIIRAKNKDFKTKLFLLDSTVRTELETLIGEY